MPAVVIGMVPRLRVLTRVSAACCRAAMSRRRPDMASAAASRTPCCSGLSRRAACGQERTESWRDTACPHRELVE